MGIRKCIWPNSKVIVSRLSCLTKVEPPSHLIREQLFSIEGQGLSISLLSRSPEERQDEKGSSALRTSPRDESKTYINGLRRKTPEEPPFSMRNIRLELVGSSCIIEPLNLFNVQRAKTLVHY